MTVYCVLELDHMGHATVVRVHTSASEAYRHLRQLEANTDGRHFYRLTTSIMENAA